MTQQALSNHSLQVYGWRRPPHWLWRRSQWGYTQVGKLIDIWIILTGRCSLHQAWQRGYDEGHAAEIHRTLIMGGR